MSRAARSSNRLTADNADVADTRKVPPPLPLSAPSAKSAVKNSEAKSDDQQSELPRGWVEIALGKLGLGRTEGIEPADEPNTLFELWSVPSFPSGKPERVRGETIGSNKQRVAEGDVLLCKINPRINRVWVVGPFSGLPQIASTEWIVFRSPSFEPRFLMWRFRENLFRSSLCANMTGVGGSLTRARPKDVAQIKIALPPLAEQRRIVAQLEALEARSRRARALLAEVPAQLAQARQSLLAAAFRGTLTANWRKTNHPSETGAARLNRLRIERRKNWELAELKKMRARGKEHADDTWKSRYVEPSPLTNTEPLPSTWIWASLLELEEGSRKSAYGVLKPGPSDPSGIRMLKSGQVRHGWVDLSEDYRISPELDEEFAKTRLRGGEVLINLVGASIGRSAVAPDETAGCNLSRAVGMIPVPREIATHVQLVLSSPLCQVSIQEKTGGSAQGVLNMEEVRSLPIPLPPEPEQHEIVRRLKAAFARLDAAERAHATAVADLDRLDQSLLARAFSGTLVPQDPADEPAAATLARG